MANGKTNLLIPDITTSRVGLAFLFTAVIGLGLSLVAAGIVGVISLSQYRSKVEAARQAFRTGKISAATSNEKANPGAIAFYLGDTFAGALAEDGSYASASTPPPEGPLALLFLNPTQNPYPTTVEFLAQKVTLETNSGSITICVPKITGEKNLWVSKSGNTYLDSSLTTLARSCR